MGAYTPNGQVWYPATGDTSKLNILLSTLASSIEDGIVPRLIKQETTKSLLGNVTAGAVHNLANNTPVTVPFSINAGIGYNDGLTIAGGIVTIGTPGLYYVATNCLTSQADGYVDLQVMKNAGIFSRSLGAGAAAGGGIGPSAAGGVIQCVAGDTVKVVLTCQGVSGAAAIHTGQATYNILSVVLLKAL